MALSVENEIGLLLSSSYELSQKILEKLNFHELLTAIKVCRTWRNVGLKIVYKRKLHYMVYHPKKVPTTECKVLFSQTDSSLTHELDEFFERFDGKPGICLAFSTEDLLFKKNFGNSEGNSITLIDRLKSSLPPNCSTSLVSGRGIVGTSERQSGKIGILSEAKLASIFGQHEETVGEDCSIRNDNKNIKLNKEDVATDNGDEVATDNVLAENNLGIDRIPTYNVGYSVEVEADSEPVPYIGPYEQIKAFTFFLLPHHPGVKINLIYFDEEKFLKSRSTETKKQVITIEEFNEITGLDESDQLKALISMDTNPRPRSRSAFVDAANRRQGGELALGGGIINNIQLPGTGVVTTGSVALTISGPNVLTASVVISQRVKNASAVKDSIYKLKQCGLPEEKSVAFMFACCGRGYCWYSHYSRGNGQTDYFNVESSEFRKQFPNTPIFGFFGEGEIGNNYLPNYLGNESPPVKKKRRENIYHRFATIILLVSYL